MFLYLFGVVLEENIYINFYHLCQEILGLVCMVLLKRHLRHCIKSSI